MQELEPRRLLAATPVLIAGAAEGGAPRITVLDAATGQERFSFLAYAQGFRGGVRVAMGDVDGDGVEDIITAAGRGGGPHVRVLSGVDGSQLRSFFAYAPGFTGGVFVATGDVDGDNRADIITAAGAGGGPHVRVFSGANGSQLASFFAYAPGFVGGVSVAAGDVDGDGRAEIITGAGAGGGPHVRVFNGSGVAIGGFFAYAEAFRGGVYVAATDLNGDGRAEIVTGAGAGGGPHVQTFNGTTGARLPGFFAFGANYVYGVPVAAANNRIYVGGYPGGSPTARSFNGSGALVSEYQGFGSDYQRGMFVAAGSLPPTAMDDDAFEENDTMAQAHDLGLAESSISHDLALQDSADWFRFRITSAGTAANYVRVQFNHAAGDIDLALYKSSGILVRRSDSVSNTEQVSLNNLAAGDYYIRVYGYQGVHNPAYTLSIEPPSGGGGGGDGGDADGANILYVNFDGASISTSDLYRWANNQWNPAWLPGGVANGITVQPFFGNRSDRETIISGILARLQADLSPFGITVQRHYGLAVESVGATTIFAGNSTLTHPHVACDVDFGNNNLTDIAFVGDENWGSAANIILAMSDVFLHEAGHTYGLYHVQTVQAGVLYPESMGLRYSSQQSQWLADTSFMDRTFIEFRDENGYWHGPGGGQSQNSYQVLRGNFGLGAPVAQNQLVAIDTSQPGVVSITTSADADSIIITQHSGTLDITINGQVYTVSGTVDSLVIDTLGDARDQVQVYGNFGAQLVVFSGGEGYTSAMAKLDGDDAQFWSGAATNPLEVSLGCCCPLCQGALDGAFAVVAGGNIGTIDLQSMLGRTASDDADEAVSNLELGLVVEEDLLELAVPATPRFSRTTSVNDSAEWQLSDWTESADDMAANHRSVDDMLCDLEALEQLLSAALA